jgi:hypothetical protein
MRTRLLLVLSVIALVSLQSCGGMETIVSVYPDGSAELAYTIEAPTGKMPDLAAMGKGDLAEIFKKDQYLSQDPQKLIDSLVTFGVQPLLVRLKQSGEIRNYTITDSVEFTQKKMRIAIDLPGYGQVGKIHSAFKREIPALDSIFRKLTNRPPDAQPDSIAIVSLGDSLEMQLHHFVIEPQLVAMSRAERIANGRRMIDSIFNLVTDPESIFSYMMGPEEKARMMDSIALLKSSASDDMLDSLGRAYQMMDNIGGELFKPKISLRAPLLLSNNESELSGRFTTTYKAGALQFEPSTPYGEVAPGSEPVRQRFKLTLPPMRATMQEERDEWRGILRWCDECETAFANTPGKQRKDFITFYPAIDGRTLIDVDCGIFGGERAKIYYTISEIGKMPSVFVHLFPQSFYLDDPASEMRQSAPKFFTNRSDLVVGKFGYDRRTNILTIERSTAKEMFNMGYGSPQPSGGSYKDRKGKWLKYDSMPSNMTEGFSGSTCAEGVSPSTEIPVVLPERNFDRDEIQDGYR